MGTTVLLVLLAILVALAVFSLRVVRQGETGAIERLGRFHREAKPGLQVVTPLLDSLRRVSVRDTAVNLEPASVITSDNVTPVVDAYFVYRVVDVKSYLYEIQNPILAIKNIISATIRSTIGRMKLADALANRDAINAEIRLALDGSTGQWGIRVTQVSVRDFQLPQEMKQAMEAQKKADAMKMAAIEQAEGEKQAVILKAEGQRQSSIAAAQGERQSRILRAEGEADAIKKVAAAQADAIGLVYQAFLRAGEAGDDSLKAVLALRYLEALERVAAGQSTKIILPTELSGAASSMETIAGIFQQK